VGCCTQVSCVQFVIVSDLSTDQAGTKWLVSRIELKQQQQQQQQQQYLVKREFAGFECKRISRVAIQLGLIHGNVVVYTFFGRVVGDRKDLERLFGLFLWSEFDKVSIDRHFRQAFDSFMKLTQCTILQFLDAMTWDLAHQILDEAQLHWFIGIATSTDIRSILYTAAHRILVHILDHCSQQISRVGIGNECRVSIADSGVVNEQFFVVQRIQASRSIDNIVQFFAAKATPHKHLTTICDEKHAWSSQTIHTTGR
jgi:hypothetical protein